MNSEKSKSKDESIKYFKLEFEGRVYVISNEHKNEIKTFLDDRSTSLVYLINHYDVEVVAKFLKSEN